MQLADIERVRAELAKLLFPEGAEDPDIFTWQMELLECDGFYAGIADTVLHHGRPAVVPKSDQLDQLKVDFVQLRAASDGDTVILRDSGVYLQKLIDLNDALLRALAETARGGGWR